MENRPTTAATPLMRISGLLCATLLSGALLAGCGSDSPVADGTADGNATGASTEQPAAEQPEADQDAEKAESPTGDLPDGFPTDVPLPGFTTSHKVGGSTEGFQYWTVVLELDYATETPVEDYVAILKDAGYAIDDESSSNIDAEGSVWDVSFHSALSGTLTISVSEQ